MGLVLVAYGFLRMRGLVDPLAATVLALSGIAALLWQAPRAFGAPIPPALSALAEVAFVFLLASAVVLWTASHFSRYAERLASELDRGRKVEEDMRLLNERLQQANGFKAQFINTAAHELATPMTPLLLQLDLLRLSVNDEEGLRSIDLLDRNMRRLNNLVRDVLDVVRLENNRVRVNMQPLRLRAIMDDLRAVFEPVARERGVGLDIEASDLAVRTDQDRVSQVLWNLLGNALKFTPRGGRVRVAAEGGGGYATIRVVDTGAGMTEEQRSKLFRPFSQVHDREKGVDGTGLGLYISKGLVDRLEGDIGCSSDGPNRGSTFWFTLPLAEAPLSAVAGPDAAEASA